MPESGYDLFLTSVDRMQAGTWVTLGALAGIELRVHEDPETARPTLRRCEGSPVELEPAWCARIEELTRLRTLREEHKDLRRDQFGLVLGRHSPRGGDSLLRAVFERAAHDLLDLLDAPARSPFPNGQPFAVAFSSDIDVLEQDHLQTVLDVLDRHGVERPTFFVCSFNAEERTIRDPEYDLADSTTRQLLEPLRRRDDVEIGLHSSYLAHDRVDWLQAQRQRVADLFERPVRGHRAHFFRFAYPRSWAWQARCGFDYDASLGYADVAGLRNGALSPLPFDDPETGLSPFAVLPTPLLDQHFHWPEPLDDGTVRSVIDSLLDEAATLPGATLCIDWHSYTHDPAFGWWRHLDTLLDAARERGAWLTGTGAVVDAHRARWPSALRPA